MLLQAETQALLITSTVGNSDQLNVSIQTLDDVTQQKQGKTSRAASSLLQPNISMQVSIPSNQQQQQNMDSNTLRDSMDCLTNTIGHIRPEQNEVRSLNFHS